MRNFEFSIFPYDRCMNCGSYAGADDDPEAWGSPCTCEGEFAPWWKRQRDYDKEEG